jgi:ribosomal protein S6--L-glutamate ligase
VAPLIDKRIVKSSSGFREQRYVIQTNLKGDAIWPIEMTLTNRDSMGFRMLLGREAMSGRVLVDPAAIPLGQPTNDNLKELYKTQRKYRFAYWSFSQQSRIVQQQTDYGSGEMRGHEMHFLNIKSATCVLMLKHRKSTIEAESF